MDEFSNEFMRLENFIEKYVPLKMQNQISETLDFILNVKDKKQLRKFEDKKFTELRMNIIRDKGLPNLEAESKAVVDRAQVYH